MDLTTLLKENMKEQYEVYCDMDGVLADFEARFEHYSGQSPSEYKAQMTQEYGEKMATRKFWELIDQTVGIRFWRGMSWMPDGKELWSYIKGMKPKLLSAPSLNEASRIGKQLWVEDHLKGTELVLSPAEEKCNYATPNSILIDDNERNVMDWKSKGGIGILHITAEQTILELKKIGL